MLGSQPSNRISIRRSKRGDSDVSSPHHQLKKLRPDRIEKEERKKRKIPQVEYEDEEEESERRKLAMNYREKRDRNKEERF